MNSPKILSFEEMRAKTQGILNNSPFYQDFDRATIEHLQTYFLWRHPEKFFFGDEEIHIVAGRVRVNYGKRFFQLKFNNNYIWLTDCYE